MTGYSRINRRDCNLPIDQEAPELSKKQLKDIVRPIVLSQGNKYIKELLRDNKIKIGSIKSDFSENINEAIDSGDLTQQMIESWLLKIEGWGNQHVYLFSPPNIPFSDLNGKITASKKSEFLGIKISYDFPEELALTSITLDASKLSMTWHQGNGRWLRAKARDEQRTIDGDSYQFRAYRERFDRSVVRLEWQFGNPYCVIFIQLSNDTDVHKEALEQVWNDLKNAGISNDVLTKLSLSKAFKNLTRNSDVEVRSTRMMTDGGHIDLVSTQAEGGIQDIKAIRHVRKGVDDKEFMSADGTFNFTKNDISELSNPIKLQGYGSDSRLRVWVQCERSDIYLLIKEIWDNNN